MRAQLRRRLEMAERVRDFLRIHNTDGVGQGLGLAKLEELLERAKVLAEQQAVGVVVTRRATKHRTEMGSSPISSRCRPAMPRIRRCSPLRGRRWRRPPRRRKCL